MVQTNYLHENLELIDSQGWAVLDIPKEFCHELLIKAQTRFKNGEFRDATVTEAHTKESSEISGFSTIRSDMTCWIDQSTTDTTENKLITFIQTVKSELSHYFRFGLTHFECHYAVYQPNKFYRRHLDQTKQNNHRFFSFVIYLNENWQPEFGGTLCGYHDEKITFEILPNAGKMVIFKSDIEHEVRPASQPRWSLTGWFRK